MDTTKTNSEVYTNMYFFPLIRIITSLILMENQII